MNNYSSNDLLQNFHLTHVAQHGWWEDIDTSKCKDFGDFGKKLYTNCNIEGTIRYIRHLNTNDSSVLILPFSYDIWELPIGYSNLNGLTVYCFGYYPDEIDDDQKILFSQTVWDNRRGNSDNPTIQANIMVGPRADKEIDAEMRFIEDHYDEDKILIEHFDELMTQNYEPQVALDQRACDYFFCGDELFWMRSEDYVEQINE